MAEKSYTEKSCVLPNPTSPENLSTPKTEAKPDTLKPEM